MRLSLKGNALTLRPDGGVWWPALETALVADVHLGKDQIFRRSGIPIPGSVLTEELGRLDRLLTETGARRLVVLGDWVHGPPDPGDIWPLEVAQWRERHSGVAMDVVLGNHDRTLEGWLAHWNMTVWRKSLDLEGLDLVHEVDQADLVPGMSGHLHPCVRLKNRREVIRMRVFAHRQDHLILPAFGAFTGGFDLQPGRDWALVALAGEKLVALP